MGLLMHLANLSLTAALAMTGTPSSSSMASLEPDPTPTATPQVRVLTEQEAQSVLLQPWDLTGGFTIEPAAESTVDITCLDRIESLPSGETSVTQSLTDGLFIYVTSAVSSYQTVEEASGVITAAEFAARGCQEAEIDGIKFAVSVTEGPDVGSDAQFMITLVASAVDTPMPVTLDLLYERVGNNIGAVGVVFAGESTVIDFAETAQRFHDKLAAATKASR